jgi:hypothetical protein
VRRQPVIDPLAGFERFQNHAWRHRCAADQVVADRGRQGASQRGGTRTDGSLGPLSPTGFADREYRPRPTAWDDGGDVEIVIGLL